jgi:hypothetical protein
MEAARSGGIGRAADVRVWQRERGCTRGAVDARARSRLHCRTVALPGEEARRAFIVPVGGADRGHAAVLAKDGSVLQEHGLFGRDEDGEQELGELVQRMQQLPKVGEGPLPNGDRWELRAGLLGNDLHHWVTHGGGGGGSGGPVMGQTETIRLVGCSGRPELQIAVGQLAKHVDAVHAFDQQGNRRHAERLRAANLTVDLFLAWTTEPGLARVAALDNGGELLGECKVPTWPPSPHTI